MSVADAAQEIDECLVCFPSFIGEAWDTPLTGRHRSKDARQQRSDGVVGRRPVDGDMSTV